MQMAPAGRSRDAEPIPYDFVAPGYFEALRVPLLSGRDFERTDDSRSRDVVVVSESLARRFFDTPQALGHQLRIADHTGDRPQHERIADIVGVVRDVKWRSLGAAPAPLASLDLPARLVLIVSEDELTTLR